MGMVMERRCTIQSEEISENNLDRAFFSRTGNSGACGKLGISWNSIKAVKKNSRYDSRNDSLGKISEGNFELDTTN